MIQNIIVTVIGLVTAGIIIFRIVRRGFACKCNQSPCYGCEVKDACDKRKASDNK